jgi:hypothetical protein
MSLHLRSMTAGAEDLEIEVRPAQLPKVDIILAHRRAEVAAREDMACGRLRLRLRKL